MRSYAGNAFSLSLALDGLPGVPFAEFMYPHNGRSRKSSRVWSGLAWSVLVCPGLTRSVGANTILATGPAWLYWHENLSKMHHAFIFIIRKHKNNVLDI